MNLLPVADKILCITRQNQTSKSDFEELMKNNSFLETASVAYVMNDMQKMRGGYGYYGYGKAYGA